MAALNITHSLAARRLRLVLILLLACAAVSAQAADPAQPGDQGVNVIAWWVSVAANVAMVGTLLVMMNKKREPIEVHPQPLQISGDMRTETKPRSYTMPECDAKHGEITNTLRRHDHEISSLWSTMRVEDEKTRTELNATFQSIQRALGRIEGKLSDTK